MKFHLKDLSLHYCVEGEGVPVLMLHGRPTDHEAMVAAFEPIYGTRTGFQRIYVDLPGMGLTRGGSWINSNDDVLEVMLAFVNEVIGERPFLLTGFSYGGYIARGILHKRPGQVAGMLLLVPAMGRGAERLLPEHRIFGQDTAHFAQYPQPFADMFASILVVHEEAVIARQGEILGGLQKADQAKMALLGENYQFSFQVDELPEPYEKPVLIVTGKFDSVTGYEQAGELAKRYPRATYIVLDRAGHGAHMEQPVLFNLLTHEWLDRVEESLRS
ncbi:alpha/beta fold hydrolase [Candidatus Leptofilum sp.]|uniref:alpha/beta fold hydrolase n=1 Tax=Candidatus Leptofilum sp. TaxID=3241576 RepID=UPI003B5C425F